MATSATLDDIADLRETDEVEVKLAGGQDGRGELPKDFWPTYSALANGAGDFIVLGLRERQGKFILEQGLAEPEKVRTRLPTTGKLAVCAERSQHTGIYVCS